MANVNPLEPIDPINATPAFPTLLLEMVAKIEADPAAPPKTDCDRAHLLREALLIFIEKNCPNSL
jgi:hypothetical protein